MSYILNSIITESPKTVQLEVTKFKDQAIEYRDACLEALKARYTDAKIIEDYDHDLVTLTNQEIMITLQIVEAHKPE